MRLHGLMVAIAVALLAACGERAPQSTPHIAESSAPFTAPERRTQDPDARSPVELFPEAAQVRLAFIKAPSMNSVETFPTGGMVGVPLTRAEIAKLRASVTSGAQTQPAAACCIPRHRFLFLSSEGTTLGALDVCFECYCARVYDGVALERRPLEYVYWDEPAIRAIVLAHGVPLE
jgi:hypothetical protein